MKRKFLLLPILVGLLSGCDFFKPSEPKSVPVESVTLSETQKSLEEGESFTLSYTINPSDATNQNVSWQTSNSTVASVSNGKVTALKEGNALISIKTYDQEKVATCSVTVTKKFEVIHVSSVSLNKSSLTLKVGDQEALTATVLPENASDKTVNWQTEDSGVATVTNGIVKAVGEGSTRVTVTTKDKNYEASCDVIVTGTVKPEVETKTFLFNPLEDSQFEKKTNVDVTSSPIVRDIFTFEFATNEGQYKPIYTYTNGSGTHKAGGSFRLYPLNSMKITSSKVISKIVFTYYEHKDSPSNSLASSVGVFNTDTWTGESGQIIFTAGGTSGARAISTIEITYLEKETGGDPIDLNVMKISEVKTYIAEHPVKVNSHQCGVDESTKVTIKGLAMASISLIKTAKAFGLNVSEPSKIIIGDETDCIAVATKTGDGTLFNKVGDNQMKNTSFYEVTGYISTYLGQPEILCTEFTWLEEQNIPYTIENMSKADVTIPEFYQKAVDVNYNCAGHGYGDVVTLKGLTCYYQEADGQGKTYYNFTDGTSNIRVNAFNIDRVSVGSTYNVTGIISLLNLSPIIVAFEMQKSVENPVDLNEFYKTASSLSITDLRAIHGSQDDTDTRYPEVINSYSKISKVSGYLCVVEENGKLYVGVSDTYKGENFIVGKDNAKANYNVALIKNDNFWNTTEERLALFNPYYNDYLCENEKVDLYYVNRQLGYKEKKPMWEILLIPQAIPAVEK